MADPFSIFAGIISVLDVGIRSSTRLCDVLRTLGNAPKEILATHNEVSDLTVVLDHARNACQTIQASTDQHDIDFAGALNEQLQQAQGLLSGLETLVNQLLGIRGSKKRLKWLRQNSKAATIKGQLRSVRMRINELLQAHHVSAVARIGLDIKAVQANVQQSHDTTISRLDSANQQYATVNWHLTGLQHSTEQSRQENSAAVKKVRNENLQMVNGLLARMDNQNFQAISHLQSITSAVQRLEDHHKETPNIPRLSTSSERSRLHNAMPTLTFVAQHRRLTCTGNCKCCCHSRSKQTSTLRLPSALQGIIGMFFVGYTGYPINRPSCDSRICLDRGKIRLEFRYIFPLWLLRLALYAIFQKTLTGGPEFGLVFRRRADFISGGIIHASWSNDIKTIKHCLATDPDCVNNIYFRDGRSALHLTLQFGHMEATRLLLNAGANPDVESDSGDSARAVAVREVLYQRNHPHILQEYSELFHTSSAIEEFDLPHLTLVVLKLRVGNLSSILGRKDSTTRKHLNSLDQFGIAPLHWAAARSDTRSIEELLRAGANINILNQNGNTPLLYATNIGASTDCINMLIDWGASIHIREPTVSFLPFHHACVQNNVEVVKRMILAGLDANSQTGYGATGLLIAAQNDSFDVLKYLLSVGADLEIQDNVGFTALTNAAYENRHGCLQLLLGKANYLHVRGDKNSILHIVAQRGDVETMDILSQHGLADLDIHARNLAGLSAEEAFQQRHQTTDDIREAFNRLIRAIERANAAEEDRVESETEDMFYDALESHE